MTERMTTANTDTTMLSTCQFPLLIATMGRVEGATYQLHALSADTTGFMMVAGGGDKAAGGCGRMCGLPGFCRCSLRSGGGVGKWISRFVAAMREMVWKADDASGVRRGKAARRLLLVALPRQIVV